MENCPSCGEQLPMVKDVFCPSCGKSLDEKVKFTNSELPMYTVVPQACPLCSTRLDDGDVQPIRLSLVNSLGQAVVQSMLAIFIFLVLIFFLRVIVGTLVFLVVVLLVRHRARKMPKTYQANCPECKWNERFSLASMP